MKRRALKRRYGRTRAASARWTEHYANVNKIEVHRGGERVGHLEPYGKQWYWHLRTPTTFDPYHGDFGYAKTKALAVREMKAAWGRAHPTPAPGTSLLGGWPLRESARHPGEKVLTCPACGSQDVAIKTLFTGRGTGPGGRHRMGDPSTEYAECQACKARGMRAT